MDLNLKPTNLSYKSGLSHAFYFCLCPQRLTEQSHFGGYLFRRTASGLYVTGTGSRCGRRRNSPAWPWGYNSRTGSLWKMYVLPSLFSVQSRSLTGEINEAQLCKIGVKYVQLRLPIYQIVLLEFPLDGIHYQNGLQKLFIKNKLMLINSDCSGH